MPDKDLRNPMIPQPIIKAADTFGTLTLYPIILGLYPVLALLSWNIQELQASDANRALLVVLLVTCLSMVVAYLVLRDWHKAGAWTTLWIVLFFSYGHVYALLKNVAVAGIVLGRHRYLIPLWLVLFTIGSWLIITRMRNPLSLTRYLNVMAIIAVSIPVYSILRHSYYAQQAQQHDRENITSKKEVPSNYDIENLPDIYYIVTDGYARSDILEEYYGYNNAEFIQFLQSRGFYVAEESVSNYATTVFSLTSSLNMAYLPDVEYDIQPWRGGYAFYKPIQRSVIRQQLANLGYPMVALATGYGPTEVFDAEFVFTPDMTRLEKFRAFDAFNAFEGMLLHTSAALILTDIDRIRNTSIGQFVVYRQQIIFSLQRGMILQNFEYLMESTELQGPKFVFVHILSPHRPYFFGSEGEEVEQHEPFSLDNIDPSIVNLEKEYYRDQLIYITTRLEEVIDEILTKSKHPPIIILQSDHGPGLGINWEKPTNEQLRDRMAILNAYHLPQSCRHQLYPTITPINTFRVTFNCLIPGSYTLLEDRSFYTYDGKVGVDFQNLTNIDDRLR